MDDIKTGEIDLIIVYKVDRLSRSLADFSKMVETFDEHSVSFVSITQQFNTSTSMGRLTLNVLLSFAQFEREVTGERIRDKVAASKKKGMWMGGYVPLGYDNVDKHLIVNPKEACTIRHIFDEYLKHGSVKKLKEKLDLEGLKTKVGKSDYGGNEFSRGALYAILQNPIYIGKIKHKEQIHNGNHESILEKQQWKNVQELLKNNCIATYKRTDAKEPSLLTGLLFDPKNHPLSPSHTRKKNRRYRYYVNQALIQFKQVPDDAVTRVPAQVIEELVQNDLLGILKNKSTLHQILKPFNLAATEQKSLIEETRILAESWHTLGIHKHIELCNLFICKITLSRTSVDIQFSVTGIANLLLEHVKFTGQIAHQSNIAIEIKRCGIETKLIIESELTQENLKPHADSLKAIQQAVKQGLIWNQKLVSGKAGSAKSIANGIDVSDRHVCQCVKLAVQCVKLAVLSPAIIKRIFQGDIPHDMTLKKLKTGIPLEWSEQEQLFV